MSTWPADDYPIGVEHALGADLSADPATWIWTKIPTWRVRGEVVIRRGRPDARTTVEPTHVAFALANDDGHYTPRNATSPLYPHWGRDTPIRVTRAGSVRATVFVADIRMRWPSGNSTVSEVHITASGVLRHLQQGAKPARSALRRAFLATGPRAYWPAEDQAGSTQLAPAAGSEVMRFAGTLSIGAAGPAGSASAVQLSTDSQMHGVVVAPSSVGWTVAQVVNVPTPVAARTVLYAWSTGGEVGTWLLILTPGSPDTISLEGLEPNGTLLINQSMSFTAGSVSEPYNRDLLVAVTGAQAFTDLDTQVSVWLADQGTTGAVTVTPATHTTGVTTLAMYPGPTLDGATVGHLTAWDRVLSASELGDIAALLAGGDGESAIARVTRLGAEHGTIVSYDLGAGTYDTAVRAMGPQGMGTFVAGLREAEAVDGGVLVELREPDGDGALLTLRSAVGLYNRSVDLALSYMGGDLAPPFEPVEDDQQLVNSFTASRAGGSSYTHELTTGPNSTAGGRVYDSAGTFNVSGDAQLPDLASSAVRMGTVDEQRYPVLSLNLLSSPHLVTAWLACDIGSRITVTGGLDQLPGPGDLDLMMQGLTEHHDMRRWEIQAACTPYSPWVVWNLQHPTLGVLHPDSWVLAEDLTTTETAVDVTTQPLCTTTLPAPVDIWVGGERMTITAISGASNPQTLTVIRSVNGVIKSHALGAEVRLWSPHTIAR